MPSGLLQTVLCDEKLQESYKRIDELFYYTMKEIVNRLETNTSVSAPVDDGRDLTPRNLDTQRMTNWKNRLKSKLEDLDILFKDDCSKADALLAWYGFFNHDYWNEQISEAASYSLKPLSKAVCAFVDNEQYIEELYPVKLSYYCRVSCIVTGNGWRPKPLTELLSILKHYLAPQISKSVVPWTIQIVLLRIKFSGKLKCGARSSKKKPDKRTNRRERKLHSGT